MSFHCKLSGLVLQVSYLKTKVQVLGGLQDDTVQSVQECGEDVEILENFTHFGCVVHNDGGSRKEVFQWIGLAHGVMDSLNQST